jgi:hypothetical protein
MTAIVRSRCVHRKVQKRLQVRAPVLYSTLCQSPGFSASTIRAFHGLKARLVILFYSAAVGYRQICPPFLTKKTSNKGNHYIMRGIAVDIVPKDVTKMSSALSDNQNVPHHRNKIALAILCVIISKKGSSVEVLRYYPRDRI